jgi:hypothetical protein
VTGPIETMRADEDSGPSAAYRKKRTVEDEVEVM